MIMIIIVIITIWNTVFSSSVLCVPYRDKDLFLLCYTSAMSALVLAWCTVPVGKQKISFSATRKNFFFVLYNNLFICSLHNLPKARFPLFNFFYSLASSSHVGQIEAKGSGWLHWPSPSLASKYNKMRAFKPQTTEVSSSIQMCIYFLM